MTTALLLATPLLIGATAADAAYKQFRDVAASCTYGANCDVTLSTTADPAGHLYGAGLSRAAGPDAPVSAFLQTSETVADDATIDFLVDGTSVLQRPATVFERNEDENRLVYAGEGLDALIAAMKAGAKVTVTVTGLTPTDFSLSGFVASLTFVDEQQGRIDATDALQAKGAKQSQAPDVRDITSIDAIPEPIRPLFADEAGDCAFMNQARLSYGGGFDAALDDGYRLVGLPCADGGAYNQPYRFWSSNDGKVEPMALPTMTDEGPSVTTDAWNVDWDPKARILTAFFKGRGIGDCGSWDKWRLASFGEGPVFVLLESRNKGDCDGNYDGGPEKWPASWPLQAHGN